MAVVKMHQAKSELSKLVARAEAGEEIVIARGDKPVARIVGIDSFEHAPKEDIAAHYKKHPTEWDEMRRTVGFGEDAEYEISGLRQAVEAGREFTIMKDGKAVAKVVPAGERKPRVPGRFAKQRGNLPPDLFEQPLTEDELAVWEGKYSSGAER